MSAKKGTARKSSKAAEAKAKPAKAKATKAKPVKAKATRPGKAAPQLHRILNCLPSPGADQDWGVAQATAAGAVAGGGPIPASVDLRAPWWPILDQGSTGSCVGQSAAGGVVRWTMVNGGKLPTDTPLSVRYVWMAAKETDALTTQATTFIDADGTTLKAALDVARKFGVVGEDLLPFMGTGLYPGDVKTFYAIAATRKIASYYRLQPGDWRRWLAEVGPILCRLDVDPTWDNVGTDGLLRAYAGPGRGGHAVCMVGYDADHFIVRNSWGESWGDKGFGYATTAYATTAFTEAYGAKL